MVLFIYFFSCIRVVIFVLNTEKLVELSKAITCNKQSAERERDVKSGAGSRSSANRV